MKIAERIVEALATFLLGFVVCMLLDVSFQITDAPDPTVCTETSTTPVEGELSIRYSGLKGGGFLFTYDVSPVYLINGLDSLVSGLGYDQLLIGKLCSWRIVETKNITTTSTKVIRNGDCNER